MLYFKKWLCEIISFFHSTLCFTYQSLTTLQLKTKGVFGAALLCLSIPPAACQGGFGAALLFLLLL